MPIYLFNSLTRHKEKLTPLIPGKIGMYVCGPTVYDFPHLGNARSVVVYDMLYRLLINTYGQNNITYIRNITDVDDKINTAAKTNNCSITEITTRFSNIFHEDMTALNCLPPTFEPTATTHIQEMIEIITKLLARGNAYIANNHVYFAIASYPEYGRLSGRTVEDMVAGARVEVDENKKHPGDFVLWKPQDQDDDISSVFDSPWGKGRPGWHIECSAMSSKYLGINFDIHGGGADLIFPHHTNEIAQSCCAEPGSLFARYWVHNGFLTVNGDKMSKSLGNFVTVRDLLAKGTKGEVLRYLLLATHYRKPIDFNDKALFDASKAINSFYRILGEFKHLAANTNYDVPEEMIKALKDDLNTPEYLAALHDLVKRFNKSTEAQEKENLALLLRNALHMIGLATDQSYSWFSEERNDLIENQIAERLRAKKEKNWAVADQIRQDLQAQGIILEDKPDGTTTWHRIHHSNDE